MTKIKNYYIVCKYFNEGNCRDGYKCLYLHPDMECNLGKKCNKDICLKTHKDLCKFGKNCKKAAKCPYKHRKKLWEKCEYGEDCDYGWNCPFKPEKKTCVYKELCEYKEYCPFKHPKKTCKNEEDCSSQSCRYKHEKKTCLFGKSCKYGETCPYKAVKKPCKFKEKCRNGDSCEYEHKERINEPLDTDKLEVYVANKHEVDLNLSGDETYLVEVQNDDEQINCDHIVEKLDAHNHRKGNSVKLCGINLADEKALEFDIKNQSKNDDFGGSCNVLGDNKVGKDGSCFIAEDFVTEVKEKFAVIYKELEGLYDHMDVAGKNEMCLKIGEIDISKDSRYIGGENDKKNGENLGARFNKKNNDHVNSNWNLKFANVNDICSETDEVKDLKEIEKNLKEIMIGLNSPCTDKKIKSNEKYREYQSRLERLEQRLKFSGKSSVFKDQLDIQVNRDFGFKKGPGR